MEFTSAQTSDILMNEAFFIYIFTSSMNIWESHL